MMNCLSSMAAEHTPAGVIVQHHSVEYFAEPNRHQAVFFSPVVRWRNNTQNYTARC